MTAYCFQPGKGSPLADVSRAALAEFQRLALDGATAAQLREWLDSNLETMGLGLSLGTVSGWRARILKAHGLGSASKGKISRLPLTVRQEIDQRLAANEPGYKILEWLNSQPAVVAALARTQPCGRKSVSGRELYITEQNLSAWRHRRRGPEEAKARV